MGLSFESSENPLPRIITKRIDITDQLLHHTKYESDWNASFDNQNKFVVWLCNKAIWWKIVYKYRFKSQQLYQSHNQIWVVLIQKIYQRREAPSPNHYQNNCCLSLLVTHWVGILILLFYQNILLNNFIDVFRCQVLSRKPKGIVSLKKTYTLITETNALKDHL